MNLIILNIELGSSELYTLENYQRNFHYLRLSSMRLLILIPLFFSSLVLGQEDRERATRHLVGLNANTISGVGPSYRFEHKRFATQVTFSGYKLGSRIKYNAGVSFMHCFEQMENGDFIVGLSTRFKHLREKFFDYKEGKLTLQTEWKKQMNAGIHIDYWRPIGNKIQLNISIGYGIYNILGGVARSTDFVNYPENIFERIINFRLKNLGTFPTAGISLYYQLNKNE